MRCFADQPEFDGDLVAEAGDVEHARPLGPGREQTDEPMLQAPDVARVADDEHAETLRAEHCRNHVGSSHHRRAFVSSCRRGERERLEGCWGNIGELAEASALDRRDAACVVAHRVHGSEEDELPVGEPLHRRMDIDQIEQAATHPTEVAHHAANVGHRRLQLGLQGRRHLVGDPIDLDLRPRLDQQGVVCGAVEALAERCHSADLVVVAAFDEQHRMDEQIDVEAVAFQHHAHRVDEERHVVGDHQHDGVRRRPAVTLAVWRHDPNDRRTGGSRSTEVEVGDAYRVDVIDLAVVDVLLGQLRVVQGEKRAEQLVVGTTDRRELTKPVERFGHVGMDLHWSTSCSNHAVGALAASTVLARRSPPRRSRAGRRDHSIIVRVWGNVSLIHVALAIAVASSLSGAAVTAIRLSPPAWASRTLNTRSLGPAGR